MAAIYNITLTRLPGQGDPRFYVRMLDDTEGKAPRKDNFHYYSEPKSNESIYT
jgi:hypothetical protein